MNKNQSTHKMRENNTIGEKIGEHPLFPYPSVEPKLGQKQRIRLKQRGLANYLSIGRRLCTLEAVEADDEKRWPSQVYLNFKNKLRIIISSILSTFISNISLFQI